MAVGLVALFALTTTDCMTSPGHGEFLSSRYRNVNFTGFTLVNSPITIQAFEPSSGRWYDIASTTSDTGSLNYFELDWHYWQVQRTIPTWAWRRLGGGLYVCRLRAFGATGLKNEYGPLGLFEKGFNNYFTKETTLLDLWNKHGHGTDFIEIYSF